MEPRPKEPKYNRLSDVLKEHGFRLSVKHDHMPREGGILVDALRIRLTRPGGESEVLWPFHTPEPDRHPEACRVADRPHAIFVRNHDEAVTECDKYDPLQWFGDYVMRGWRASMSPDDYYPLEAPAGPHASYSHYRTAMLDSGEYHQALELLNTFGDDLFEVIERAARRDAGTLLVLEHEPATTETRAVVVANFAPDDVENNIDDAIRDRPDEEAKRLELHTIVEGKLCCPFCQTPCERCDLGIYPVVGRSSKRRTFAWGCTQCFPKQESEMLSLDRMASLDKALKWTDHMLSKSYYQHPKALKTWLACLHGIFGWEVLGGRL